jgi:microcystin-dependent protein|tara:strand:- start:1254 stop:1541 length:288 start_codon:yes stop_codon:yes gene_type:complete
MTVQEIMERSGSDNTTLTVAFIKDAIHLIQSQQDDNVATWKTNINLATSSVNNIYPFPANLIKLRSISVKDTGDKKYKRIKRLSFPPVVTEDTDP